MPWAGAPLAVTVRPVPRSFDNTVVPLSTMPAGVVPVSFAVVGLIETLTVAVAVPPWPSDIVYVKLSVPL